MVNVGRSPRSDGWVSRIPCLQKARHGAPVCLLGADVGHPPSQSLKLVIFSALYACWYFTVMLVTDSAGGSGPMWPLRFSFAYPRRTTMAMSITSVIQCN